ncbi:CaiB/BaiF CoA transferase family protein [Rhodococcus sp. 27YEA15]|uniref:CaiB/BaiF CoA transferase family protein n=1 Tax=Rhodococcus sp. 27YEA15 TaxID=3156259 RepID=UPI003C7A4A6B
MTPGALDGLLVADFSRVLAGPYLTMLLGDLGATVIKVESSDGDQTRGWGPPWRDGQSTYYQAINRNKQSIVLNLKDPADRDLAAELARRADVLVENFLPGTMRKFGLDYDSVSETNPGIVYCSLSGFGSHPDAAGLPGFDLVAQAVGGLMSITGEADGPPTKVGVALVDAICGLHGGIGVLAAVAARKQSSRGQLVEVSLFSSLLSALTNQAAGYLMGGVVPGRAGNAHPSVAPYEVFETRDNSIVIAAGTDVQFVRLCQCLDLDALSSDPRFSTNSARVSNRLELRELLIGALKEWTSEEAVQRLSQASVPVGPVNDLAAAFKLAETLGLDPVWDIDGVDHVRAPMTMSVTPPRPTSAPPMLDAHGTTLRAWLSDNDAGADVNRNHEAMPTSVI